MGTTGCTALVRTHSPIGWFECGFSSWHAAATCVPASACSGHSTYGQPATCWHSCAPAMPGAAAGMRTGGFTAAKFARDGSLGLFTLVKLAGNAHLVAWLQDATGDLVFRAAAKAYACPATGFDISPCGAFLGAGSTEGAGPMLVTMLQGRHSCRCYQQDRVKGCRMTWQTSLSARQMLGSHLTCSCGAGEVSIFSAASLMPVSKVRAGHMSFVTAVAFAPDSSALLSVSLDASARTTPTQVVSNLPGSKSSWLLLLLLILLVALVAIVLQLDRTRSAQ